MSPANDKTKRSPRPIKTPGARIGLLGGSFNPAHDGHRHISLIALRRLGLDQVWWLVSPQNPLKSSDEMAPFEDRLAQAGNMADHPKLHVSDIEQKLGTTYSVDTIAELQSRNPDVNFVWLMGGDNLAMFHKWHRWQDIMTGLPVCVMARPGYLREASTSPAARRFASSKISDLDAKFLPSLEAPAWALLQERLHPQSATQIRRQSGKGG
jgi:nicotinate-nucleotide adenylyltransferase